MTDIDTHAITVTFFANKQAQSATVENLTLPQLAAFIAQETGAGKAELPWLKLALFGDRRSDKKCLRTNINTVAISGVEAEHDAGDVSFDAAVATLRAAKVRALVYTSPSWAPGVKERWRILAPLSQNLPPRERGEMVARLNGLFRGKIADESFVLSQAFLFGHIDGAEHREVVIDGEFIDRHENARILAQGKSSSKREGNSRGNSKPGVSPGRTDAELQALLERSREEGKWHNSMLSAVATMFGRGMSVNEIYDACAPYCREGWGDNDLDVLIEGAEKKWSPPAPDLTALRALAAEHGGSGNAGTEQASAGTEQASAGTEQEQARDGGDLFDPWARFVVPPFPLDVLPPVVGEFVVAQAAVIGVDEASMAMCGLGAISGALDHGFRLKMMRHGTWYVSPRLWVLLYGDASTKKTPSLNAATGPLEQYQKELQQTYKRDLVAHEVACSMAAAAGKPKPEKPEPPIRLVTMDATIEKLGELLARGERGLLVKRDEIAGWIGAMEKYGSGKGGKADRAFWMQTYDGGSYVVDRIGRGEIFVDNLSISLLGGIQPERLAELHGLTSDGLLQRFIPVVMGLARLPLDQESGSAAYDRLVRTLIQAPPRTLTLSDPALKVMEELRAHLHELAGHAGGLARGFQSFLGKLQGVAGSLALILHMAADAKGGVIEARTAEGVRRLVVEFILPHALEFYRSAESTTGGDRLKRLASWILTSGAPRFVASDLTSNVTDFRGLTLFDVNERVSPLVAAGWLTPDDPRLGTWNRAWSVNPAVFAQFAARAKQEEAAKATLAELMGAPRRKH